FEAGTRREQEANPKTHPLENESGAPEFYSPSGVRATRLGDTDELAPTVHNSSYHTIYQLSIGIYEVLVSKLVRGERRKRTPRPTLWKTRVGHPNSTSHSTSGPPAIFSLSFGFGDGHEKEAANTMTPDHLSKG